MDALLSAKRGYHASPGMIIVSFLPDLHGYRSLPGGCIKHCALKKRTRLRRHHSLTQSIPAPQALQDTTNSHAGGRHLLRSSSE